MVWREFTALARILLLFFCKDSLSVSSSIFCFAKKKQKTVFQWEQESKAKETTVCSSTYTVSHTDLFFFLMFVNLLGLIRQFSGTPDHQPKILFPSVK